MGLSPDFNAAPVVIIESEDVMQEACGLVAIYSPDLSAKRQIKTGLMAAKGVQNRGQHGAGAAIRHDHQTTIYTGNGLLRDVFTIPVINDITPEEPPQWVMVHTRYGTNGGYGENNLQPCHAKTKDGHDITVIHNGEFVATDEMRKKIKGKMPEDVSDTYLFTQLLAQQKGTPDEKVINALAQVDGAASLIIGIDDTLYVARDRNGIRPLHIGQLPNGGYIFASETHAFDKVGATTIRSLHPGEVMKVGPNGLEVLEEGQDGKGHFCAFELDYFAGAESLFPMTLEDLDHPERWSSTALFRRRCGEVLAQEMIEQHSPAIDADMVIGVPDSGVPFAMGLANALNIPYFPAIFREHHDEEVDKRLFQGDDDLEGISAKVLAKLTFDKTPGFWKGKNVILGDDSIVRSKVSKELVKALKLLGINKIYFAVGYPPVMHTCHLGVSMRTEKELVAPKFDGDSQKIAEEIGADGVYYITPEGFVQAARQEHYKVPTSRRTVFMENDLCGGCVTGLYPVNKNGTTDPEVIQLAS